MHLHLIRRSAGIKRSGFLHRGQKPDFVLCKNPMEECRNEAERFSAHPELRKN